MGNVKPPRSQWSGLFPIPQRLVDAEMHLMRDTELRILLVVSRQTLGWRDRSTGRLKSREWISHRWFQKVTGRSSASVSSAIDGLVRRGLLLPLTETNNLLLTPEARRSYRGKIYYALGSRLMLSTEKGSRIQNLRTIKAKEIIITDIKEGSRAKTWRKASDMS